MSSVDSITITSVSTVNQIEITSTDGITVTTVGTQGLAGPSAIMQKGVDATTIGAGGNGSFLVYDHTNSQWTSSTSTSVANLTVEIQKLRIGGTGATVVSILDEDNMASDSATSLATQQSIKAYVESRVGIDNLAALLVGGNTTGGTDISVSANDDITFADSSKSIYGAGSDLQIYHDGTNSFIANSQGALKIATETSGITVNIGHTTSTVAVGDDLTVAGNQTISGTLGVTGAITGSLTGNVTGQVSDISNFTTANLTENTNLYFTNERVDDRVSNLLVAGTGITLTYDDNSNTLTIDGQVGDITSVVAGDGLTGGGTSGDVTLTVNVDNSSIEINSDTLRIKALGVTNDMLSGSIPNSKLANSDFSINSNTLVLGNSLVLDTDDIGEGSNNQYYTTSRANSDFDIRLATKDTDDLAEGVSRLYYTTARANSAIDNRVTKSFVDALGVQAGSVTANSVALGTDTTGDYIQTITGTANKITVSGSGSESADVTLTLPDDVQIANNLTVAGNLTVNGTLTSLDTTNLDIEDNLFLLNAGLTGSPVNDSGMLINRGSSTNAVFMWDESVDKFTLGLTSADGTATGNITVSSLGTLVANLEGNVTGNVTGNSSTATALETGRTIALSGDVTASGVSFDGSGNITLTTTIEPNSVALGTDTTGNYVASLVEGTGVTISNNTGENATPTIAIGQVVSTTSDVTFNTVTADIIGNINGATEFSAQAGEALSKGDAVYISGISGNTPIVSKADADDSNKMPSFGLAKADANLNANVVVVTFGTLSGLDTSSFSAGDILFISTTAGTLSATAPTGESSLIQNIGIVQRSHASAGSIKVGGAGRTNATPNLNNGKIFLGNGSNQAVSTTLDTSVVPENTNLYYTDARAQAVSINNVVEDTTPQLGGNLDLNSSDITGTGNINITGTIQSSGNITGTLATAAQPNITSLGTLTGLTTTGDINFGDNDKAIFGADSDLKMYHSGTTGTIENYTGTFLISNSSDDFDVIIQSDNGSGGLADYFRADGSAGSAILYNYGNAKLATTSTGIDVTGTVVADGLTVDGTGDFNIGTENIGIDVTSTDAGSYIRFNDNNATGFYLGTNAANFSILDTGNSPKLKINSNGDISFYEDTGTTAKLFWDASAESLGIGTTSPAANTVHIASNTNTTGLKLQNTATSGRTYQLMAHGGGSSLASKLSIYDETAGTHRLVIDSSGNVLVGKTGTAFGTAGVEASASNGLWSTRSSLPPLALNRLSSDGSIVDFYKDGSAVGSIGIVNGDRMVFATADGLGLQFDKDNNRIIPCDAAGAYNNNVELGDSSLEFTNLWLSGTANASTLNIDGGTIKLDGNYPVGSGNVALGNAALDDGSLSGNNNTAIGNNAMTANTSGGFNVAVGVNAMISNTTGTSNTALGNQALDANTTASNNTAVGSEALGANTTGTRNVAVGGLALDANTTANDNTAIGYQSLSAVTTGQANTVLGSQALDAATTGTENIAIGYRALSSDTQGQRNVAIGNEALFAQNITSATNTYNTAIGFQAMYNNTTGTQNTAVGGLALDANTTANYNTAIGYATLTSNTTGTENTALGRAALNECITGSENTAVGSSALEVNKGSNNVAVGRMALRDNSTGTSNTALGHQAMILNTTAGNNTAVGKSALGANTTGGQNTAVGALCLDACTTGDRNTAIGYIALSSITGANDNTAVGREALRDNVADANTAMGEEALKLNTSGTNNVAIGKHAMNVNTTGSTNVAIGRNALDANTTASNNTAVGDSALGVNTTGIENTSLGKNAGGSVTTGQENVYIGSNAGSHGVAHQTGSRCTILGAFADAGTTGATDAQILGYNVTGSGGYTTVGSGTSDIRAQNGVATWSTVSDERVKKDITDATAGLSFINDLRPRTFKYKNKGDLPKEFDAYEKDSTEPYKFSTTEHGFIAQEVKAVIDNHSEIADGFKMWSERETGQQEVAEAALIPILTKAIQELSSQVDELKAEIQTLKGE